LSLNDGSGTISKVKFHKGGWPKKNDRTSSRNGCLIYGLSSLAEKGIRGKKKLIIIPTRRGLESKAAFSYKRGSRRHDLKTGRIMARAILISSHRLFIHNE
jgi:hypothetical protein